MRDFALRLGASGGSTRLTKVPSEALSEGQVFGTAEGQEMGELQVSVRFACYFKGA